MKRLKLYKIEPIDRSPLHVVARSSDQAAAVFMTWDAARDRVAASFTVEPVPLMGFKPYQQFQLRRAFALAIAGVAHFDDDMGWTFDLIEWVCDDDLDGGQS